MRPRLPPALSETPSGFCFRVVAVQLPRLPRSRSAGDTGDVATDAGMPALRQRPARPGSPRGSHLPPHQPVLILMPSLSPDPQPWSSRQI